MINTETSSRVEVLYRKAAFLPLASLLESSLSRTLRPQHRPFDVGRRSLIQRAKHLAKGEILVAQPNIAYLLSKWRSSYHFRGIFSTSASYEPGSSPRSVAKGLHPLRTLPVARLSTAAPPRGSARAFIPAPCASPRALTFTPTMKRALYARERKAFKRRM